VRTKPSGAEARVVLCGLRGPEGSLFHVTATLPIDYGALRDRGFSTCTASYRVGKFGRGGTDDELVKPLDPI